MRKNPDLAGLVKAVDIARAYYKGIAFAKGMRKAQDNSLAEDTMKDGFVTLTDKKGNQYVAQCGTEEKERYKETGKKLSQVRKEEKEKKQPKKYASERERIEDIIKQLDEQDKEYNKTNTFVTKQPSYLDVRKAMESDFVKNYPALSNMFTKGQFEDNRYLAAVINNNDFADKKEFKKYLKDSYPGLYDVLRDYDKENFFKSNSPSAKFFGDKGMDRYSNKYYFINHRPDDKTVILDDVADRLRVTGKGDLIFLTDKNKGYFINEKNMLPILSYNNDDNSHTLSLAVKLNKDYLKEYTFKSEFAATEGMTPITKGFEQLQQMAEVKDHPLNRTGYRNVDSKQVDTYKAEYLQNLYITQQAFKKPAETVSTGGKAHEMDKYLDGWNKKIYKYKDGTRAIFSNNQKIVLTEEQYNYLKDKAAN